MRELDRPVVVLIELRASDEDVMPPILRHVERASGRPRHDRSFARLRRRYPALEHEGQDKAENAHPARDGSPVPAMSS